MASKTAAGGGSRGVYQPDSDVHITYEDQQKINSFAKFIAKIKDLNEDLKIKENELKTLEEASEEIELFDEDEQIPYLIGEVFISHNLPKTQELLATAKQAKKAEIKGIQDKCAALETETSTLKAMLYQRFGNNIYLENDE